MHVAIIRVLLSLTSNLTPLITSLSRNAPSTKAGTFVISSSDVVVVFLSMYRAIGFMVLSISDCSFIESVLISVAITLQLYTFNELEY